MKVKDNYHEIFSSVNRALVVLAHPDDMEINAGGVMARLIEGGKKVRLVVTTNGNRGTKEKVIEANTFGKQRIEEQKKAGKILGIPDEENFNLNISDGEVETTLANIEKIAYHIRKFKPDLVITHNLEDAVIDFYQKSGWVNHRDHRNTGMITIDAVYPYARDSGFFPEQLKQGLSVHVVKKILLTDSYIKPSVKYFSIDKVLEKKKKALQQHLSAFDPTEADEYMEENKFDNGYFEPLGYYEVY